ncbi:unnamed protein product [Rotaria sp. Silwood2]|nr:unnamed protein product [Rotaria sp. Silwood2]CAF4475751.1 unnamed protein product [Rotaria sp. Silwood2]
MIINNYLECSETIGLNEIHLKNYSHLLDDSQCSEDLKIEALNSVLLTVKRNKDIPEFIIETLFRNINKGNDKLDNFVVLVIEILSKLKEIKNIDDLSAKLLKDEVIGEGGIDISFENSSQENSDCQSISLIVARIFVNSLQKNVRVNDESIENLVKALNSNNKQTCILSAKSLYLVSKAQCIKNNFLVALKEHVDNSISDVSLYSTVAYTQGLEKLSSAGQPIMTSHIDFLSNVYAFEELQLEEEDFTDVVNRNILSTLWNVAANHLFEENIFRIFDHIFLFESPYALRAIEILTKYSANKYPIQDSTIAALQNVAGMPKFLKEILQLFENITYNEQIIGEKILPIIADNFYRLDNEILRNQSFHILDKANDNQDVSEEIFDIMELERASLTISRQAPDTHDAITYLREETTKGKRITINVFRALSELVSGKYCFIIDGFSKVKNLLRIL